MNIVAAVFGSAMLAAVPYICQATDYNDVDQVVGSRVYIVGSIADINEVKQTLETLEFSGMMGAFLVDLDELRLYPQTAQLITKKGHKIILRMKKQKEPVTNKVAGQKIAAKAQEKFVQKVEKVQSSATPAQVSAPDNRAQRSAVPDKISVPNTKTSRETLAQVNTGTHFADKLPSDIVAKEVKITPAADSKVEEPQKPNQALKVVGQPSNTNISNAQLAKPVETKKQRIARDFLGVNEKGEKVALRYPATAKDINDVPEWSIASLVKLSDYGLLAPDDIHDILSEPDRLLMAKLTARAYHLANERDMANGYDARFELDKLLLEYDTELRDLGYGAGDYANYAKLPQNLQTRIGGELRYNYVNHSGDKPYDFYDSRLRVRLYVEQPLDEDWKLYGMGEANKSWVAKDYTKFALERLYLAGSYKEVNIVAGRFGLEYGDGNIYDGRLTGLSVSAGTKLKLQVDYGRLRENQTGGCITAAYKEPRYDLQAGLYHFDKSRRDDQGTTIGTLGGMYYIGNFGAGAMYLYSTASDANGDSNGYVVTVKYGRNRSWIPGTYEIFARYYDQADYTYIAHTMTGLADYMHGFKGFSFGASYSIMENMVYSIEYYDLKEKTTGLKGRTLWNHIAYYF